MAQTGKIIGTVVDENGETMPGVGVYLKGEPKGISTDIDGKFIYTLNPGTYTLIFKFVSYKEKNLAGIVVEENKVNDLSVKMTPQDDSVLTEFTVVVTLNRAEDPAMDLARKKSANFQDGVTQATLRKSPASTASDAIKKITGATIQDNKFAIIRGMGDRYNAAYINGAPLPSSETDRKAISFEIFPANLLDNITIVKTATPDVPGEFAGGIININTKSIPDETSQMVTVGAGYNTNTTFKDFQTYEGGKTDWIGLDDGTRALPDGTPDTETLRNLGIIDRGVLAKSFVSDWKLKNVNARPNLSAQYTLGISDTLFGNSAGLVLGLNYGSNNAFSDIYRQEYEEGGLEVLKRDSLHDVSYTNNVVSSALLNMAYKFGANHIIKFNNIYSINSEDKVTIRSGARELDQSEKQWEKGSVRWFTQNTMYSGQLSGNHTIRKIRFDWNGGYSNVQREIPNMRRMIYQKTSVNESDTINSDGSIPQYAAIIDANNSRSGGIMFFSNLNETISSAKGDLTIPVTFKKTSKFKFDFSTGGLYQKRSRAFSARNIGFDKYKIGTGIKFDSELLLLDEENIFANEYMGQMTDSAAPYNGGFAVKETTRSTDSYVASSELKAGYGMLDFKLNAKFRLITGARLENYNQFLETESNGQPLIIDTTVTDILPSANFIFTQEFAKKNSTMVLRAAYYRTVSRPEFRELAVFNFYDFVTDFELYGNEKLQRATIDNYDFRAEYYPMPGQIISGSVFYKKITNATELANRPDVLRTLFYTNVSEATNIGAEFEYRIKLGLFRKKDTSEFVQNTSFFANFALIKSSVDTDSIIGATASTRPLQGQSPYLVNAGISTLIPWVKISATISYNLFGRRLYIVGSFSEPDYWENPRHLFDAQLSREFGKHWVVKLNIRDILAQKQIFYQDIDKDLKYDPTKDNTMISTQNGRVFSFAVSYKF
jgi:outer membrane receptor protein involved in Fe transport